MEKTSLCAKPRNKYNLSTFRGRLNEFRRPEIKIAARLKNEPIGISGDRSNARVLRISALSAAAFGWVSAVTTPIPPAFDTAAARGAYPT